LCLQLGDIPEYFQALFGLWGHSWMGGKNDDALRLADEFLSRSRALSQPVPLMVAHRVMGSTLLTIGDFQSSANHFTESIKLSRGKGRQPLSNLYMVEPQAASLLLLSWDLWFLGYPDQSLSRVSEALALGQNLGHPYTVAFAHYMMSVVHLLRGEAARAGESQSALSIVEGILVDIGDVTGRSWESELHRQKAQLLLVLNPRKTTEAESHLKKSIEVARGQSSKSLELRAATSLAELWLAQGRTDEARTLLEPICRWFDEGAETGDLRRARDTLNTLGRSY
jgi:tetratricopeptide (TPR) repeat protein